MAISTYSELKAFIAEQMARGDAPGSAVNAIFLGEAGLNRELPAIETDTILTGTADNRRIDISSLSIVSPVALFLKDISTGDEREVTRRSDGTMAYSETSGAPTFWAMDGTNIDFDCPLNAAYSFRFRYVGRFALSDSAPTNWLLTNHPDVYIAASIVWGNAIAQDTHGEYERWAGILGASLPSVRNILAQAKRATLTVDPALTRARRFNFETGE